MTKLALANLEAVVALEAILRREGIHYALSSDSGFLVVELKPQDRVRVGNLINQWEVALYRVKVAFDQLPEDPTLSEGQPPELE